MEIILVDDREIDLLILEKYLERYSEFKHIRKYSDPVKALDEMVFKQPDLVFVDIDMPKMNGLEFAKKTLTYAPNAMIVFVSAYERYALDAFQVYPLDYILKPIRIERLDQTVRKFLEQTDRKDASITEKKLVIKSFGNLEVLKEDKYIKWHGAKTEELFAFLLCHYNKRIHKDVIIEALWSNRSHKSALASMQTAMHRVRRALDEMGDHAQIDFNSNTYILKLKNVEFDLLNFQKSIQEIKEINAFTINKAKETLALYNAPFLESNGYIWSYSKQVDLERSFIKLLTLTVSYLSKDGNYSEAIEFLKNAEKNCPTNIMVKNLLKIMRRDQSQLRK